ncbi:MAG: pyrroline-5-carboxylate reductase [Burkholderiaceae bacterium]|jgi:pyrroline-5-carboxylate reductase|nr:pyrroline-5-carboxylate reductase [Burkholderiaceae bacterium]
MTASPTSTPVSPPAHPPALPDALASATLAFIGGGNMATAILGALLRNGLPARQILVLEPDADAAARLTSQWHVAVERAPSASFKRADLVIWAVKPQVMREAALPVAPWTADALHLSVAAGIPTQAIAAWLGTRRLVRCMPNTPALIGHGMAALFASTDVSGSDRALAENAIRATGACLWVAREELLDAVTALSGSGPAYVFYFLEAMAEAGTQLGLSAGQSLELALNTFAGASALALQSGESPAVLRERVTSKGGTTFAALTALDQAGVKPAFIAAMHAAAQRAGELGAAFGQN